MLYQKKLKDYRRIVIKIGSSLLVDPKTGIRHKWLTSLCEDIAKLHKENVEILLVSSGAIALGRTIFQQFKQQLKLEESQAYAAIGQIELSKSYGEKLSNYNLQTAQILLTFGDTEERERYLNARSTIETLLKWKVIPIVNENDTVATQEIRYGDNDRLAARVSTMIQADLLILLSDIDGLYTAPPHLDPNAKFISFIENITPEIENMAGCSASIMSKGGMKTKLDAGKLANQSGTAMLITSGTRFSPLSAIDKGERCSYFLPKDKPANAWKTWLSGQLEASGYIVIDQGAMEALYKGKSLLSAGVKAINGHFQRGDVILIKDEKGCEIARGLTSYDSENMINIAGQKSEGFEKKSPFLHGPVVVHRNDMVIFS